MTSDRTAALAVSHPGHELRLMKWIAETRPIVFLLTAGSRSGTSRSRVEASRQLAGELGAVPSNLFGRHLDRDVYGWIMAGDASPFVELADEMAASFVSAGVGTVITDSWQHYNVVHDLWHLTVRLAVAGAGRQVGRRLTCLDYSVVPHHADLQGAGPEARRLALSDEEVERKWRLARAYPEITEDIAEVMALGGQETMRQEVLHEVHAVSELVPPAGRKPLYERFGEARVAAGLYASVLRWEHVQPIYNCLSQRLLQVEPIS